MFGTFLLFSCVGHCFLANLPTFINSGSPKAVPVEYDCAIRRAAYAFGKKLRPTDAGIIFDALQLHVCGERKNSLQENSLQQSSNINSKLHGEVTIRVKTGDSIHAAVDFARRDVISKGKRARIVLSGGTHFLGQTLELGPEHSGLTLTGEEGAVLSGGVRLNVTWRSSPHCVNVTGIPGCLEADISSEQAIPGLRQGDRRLIRARYPNANPSGTCCFD